MTWRPFNIGTHAPDLGHSSRYAALRSCYSIDRPDLGVRNAILDRAGTATTLKVPALQIGGTPVHSPTRRTKSEFRVTNSFASSTPNSLSWPYRPGSTRTHAGVAIRSTLRLGGTSHRRHERASPYPANRRNADVLGRWLRQGPPLRAAPAQIPACGTTV